jgi:hypothetical protein
VRRCMQQSLPLRDKSVSVALDHTCDMAVPSPTITKVAISHASESTWTTGHTRYHPSPPDWVLQVRIVLCYTPVQLCLVSVLAPDDSDDIASRTGSSSSLICSLVRMRIIGWSVRSVIQALGDISFNTAQPHPDPPTRTRRDG